MRFGVLIEGSTIDEISRFVAAARSDGYTSAWLTDGIGFEPLTALTLAGRAVPDIELGTAVVRTLPRHPMALAQHAMTVNAAIGGRLILGLGPSHPDAMEQQWGLSYDRVMAHMRDYLSIVMALVHDGSVDHRGARHSAHATLFIDEGRGFPVLVGALGEQMLRLAGTLADGTVAFMTGPHTLRTFTCPTIATAADRVGRPSPRVVALLPVIVTDDVETARTRLAGGLGRMATLPSYAAAVAREGGLPLVAGTEDRVREELAGLEAAGVTDVVATRLARRGSDDEARTRALLAALCVEGRPA